MCCDTASHLILSARVARGPGNECILWRPLLKEAARYTDMDTSLADKGFDSEDNHVYARKILGIRLTIIPLNPRTHGSQVAQIEISPANAPPLS